MGQCCANTSVWLANALQCLRFRANVLGSLECIYVFPLTINAWNALKVVAYVKLHYISQKIFYLFRKMEVHWKSTLRNMLLIILHMNQMATMDWSTIWATNWQSRRARWRSGCREWPVNHVPDLLKSGLEILEVLLVSRCLWEIKKPLWRLTL